MRTLRQPPLSAYSWLAIAGRHLRHYQLLSKRHSLEPGKSPNLRLWSWYSMHILAGTFCILGYSSEHPKRTGPYAHRLIRPNGYHDPVNSGHLEHIQRSPLPKRHRCSSSTIMRRTQRDTWWKGYFGTSNLRNGQGKAVKFIRSHIAVIGCIRYQSPDAAYAYPTRPSKSLSVCAWTWTIVSHLHAPLEQNHFKRDTLTILEKKHWPFNSSPPGQLRDLVGFESCRCSLNRRTNRPT